MSVFCKYAENWPKIGAVVGMALGGGSILAASRKKPIDLRTLAIVNSMTMAAHQVEEYIEPGYFGGYLPSTDSPASAGGLAESRGRGASRCGRC